MQILTPDFSGLPTSPLPTSPLLLLVFLPSSLPPSLLPLRKFDSVLSSLFGVRLALRILRPHSLTLTLTLSLSHCLSHLSHLSHLFLISLISLSSLSLSLSLLSVSRLSVSLLSLLSQEDPSKEPHIKDSSPLPPQRAPCFFLPRCPPLSHSGALAFAPLLASSDYRLEEWPKLPASQQIRSLPSRPRQVVVMLFGKDAHAIGPEEPPQDETAEA